MPDAEDTHGNAVLVKANAVIADAKTILGRINVLKALDTSSTGFGETFDGLLHSASDSLIESSHVC
jgi:hypothetical protein